MNENKIVDELNEWAKKELGSHYSVMDDSDLTLYQNDNSVAWFFDFKKCKFGFSSNSKDCSIQLIKKGIIEKFYEKGVELLAKYEPKYTVQVFPQERGYLNVNHDFEPSNDVTYDIGWPEDRSSLTKTEFTQSEIEGLKKRDIAIDWDKAVIKEVE